MNQDEQETIEKRLARAEYTLKMLEAGGYPHLKRFVFGMSTDFRLITDRMPFQKETKSSSINEKELLASESKFVFRSSHDDGQPRFYVYFEDGLSEKELAFADKAYQSFMSTTLTAIGLDMKPLKFSIRSKSDECS